METEPAGLRMLAVDDSTELLAVRAAVFGYMGFQVVTADKPQEALAYLQQHPVDILLTDQEMPGLCGLSLAKLARGSGFAGPILLVTASEELCQLESPWVDRIVSKALAPQQLHNAVRRCMACRASRGASPATSA